MFYSIMGVSALKKRKLSSLLGIDDNENYMLDAAMIGSNNSCNQKSEHVLLNGPIRSGCNQTDAREEDPISWSSNTYGSNMFLLKTTELLAEVRSDYERHMIQLESSLRRLEDIIERIPDRQTKPVCLVAFIFI